MAVQFRHQLLRLFTDHPGKIMYADDLARELNVGRKSIINCVYNMRRTTPLLNDQIEVVVHGNAWRYAGTSTVLTDAPQPANGATVPVDQLTAPAAPVAPAAPAAPAATPTPAGQPQLTRTNASSPRVFEELGTNNEGHVLVADEEGSMYWLVPTKRGASAP